MQDNFEREFIELTKKFEDLKLSEARLFGQRMITQRQIDEAEIKIADFKHRKEVCSKAVELLTLVQKETKDKIKEGFESIVTYALRYIYSENYSFELEFGRRGNLQEIDFNIKTPSLSKSFDPLDSSGGGVLDIISLALRIALLEVSKPRIEGFIALDESFKHLSSVYLERASSFLKAINEKINRQIILVTHQNELINNSDKALEIKK